MITLCRTFVFLYTLFQIVFTENSEKPCEIDFSVEIDPHLKLKNGSLWDLKGATLYENGTYWTEEGGGKLVTRGCPCLLGRPCLRKCCPLGEVADAEGHCSEDQRGDVLQLNVSNDDGTLIGTVDAQERFALLFGVIRECERKFYLKPGLVPRDGYYLRVSDGRLVLYERNITYGPYVFCYDLVSDLGEYRPFICEPPMGIDRTAAKFIPFFLLTSAVFLLLTFLVYVVVPELRNLHGIILMCHILSLFLAFVFFAAIAFAERRITRGMCLAAAFCIEFFLIAAFFWLNVMCFDICITFGGMRPTRIHSRSLKQDLKKLYLYFLYAWGSPTIILIVTVIMQFSPDLPDNIIRPEFGKNKCYFYSRESLAAYIYAPITTLIVSNIIMFIITSVKIYKLNKETNVLMTACSKRHAAPFVDYNKERLFLYIKLFVVMGVTWMMDFIAWIVGAPKYYFYVTEIWNSLQGFFIFIIFVWKKSVRRMLQQRICPKMPHYVDNVRKYLGSLIPCAKNRGRKVDEISISARNTVDSSLLSSNLQDDSFKMNDSSRRPTTSSSTFMEPRPQEGDSPTHAAQ